MCRRPLVILGLAILAVLSLFLRACGQLPVSTPTAIPSPNATSTPINPNWTPPEVQQPVLPGTADVVAKARPSVVNIDVEVLTHDLPELFSSWKTIRALPIPHTLKLTLSSYQFIKSSRRGNGYLQGWLDILQCDQ
jgi:hypothetical protein